MNVQEAERVDVSHESQADVLVIVVAAGVILVWLLWGIFAPKFLVQTVVPTDPSATAASQLDRAGQFGDAFGAINALFTAMAFVAVWWTGRMQRAELKLQRQEIRMQRSSLDLQREELRQTRKELHDQTLQFAAQNRTLSQQTADNTFFQLLRLHNEIVGAIDLVDKQTKQPIAKGRDCFQTFVLYLKRKYSADSNRTLEQTVNSYVQFYQEHQADLGHYFRSLYNIVKFVDRTDFDDKRRYTNLVRAQLSSYEQVLLFYNCLSALGAEKFKPLVEEYALLKHIPRELLVHEGKSLLHYAGRAYG